jgi:hypothetical protein
MDQNNCPTGLLLAVAIALHNLEEMLWLPRWSRNHHQIAWFSVEPGQFRFAAGVLTMIVLLLFGWAKIGGPGSVGHYLLAAYGLGQSLNILLPHAAASWLTKSYMPGLATGVLIVLPVCLCFAYLSVDRGCLLPDRLLLASVILVPTLVLVIPLLFRLSGRVPPG